MKGKERKRREKLQMHVLEKMSRQNWRNMDENRLALGTCLT